MIIGAPTRTRTANLLITNQLLYQLSYEGAKSFLVENIKLSKPNKDNSLFFNIYLLIFFARYTIEEPKGKFKYLRKNFSDEKIL